MAQLSAPPNPADATVMVPAHMELGHHVAIVGQNEAGKTRSAIIILERAAYMAPVMVIDSKPEEDLEELPGTIYETPGQALAANDWITIYRPRDEYHDPEQIEQFIRAFYAQERPACVLYMDESYHCVRGTRADQGIANVLMRGRKRLSRHRNPGSTLRMSVVASSQRPRWIPLAFWTESKHYYVHYLAGRDDRQVIAGYIGFPELIVDRPVEGHEFYYYRQNTKGVTPRKYVWEI